MQVITVVVQNINLDVHQAKKKLMWSNKSEWNEQEVPNIVLKIKNKLPCDFYWTVSK
jgi:hypothetical protein